MQRAEGTRGDAPPDGRGLNSGEELRPPKEAGKDRPLIHRHPLLYQWGNRERILEFSGFVPETHDAVKTFLPACHYSGVDGRTDPRVAPRTPPRMGRRRAQGAWYSTSGCHGGMAFQAYSLSHVLDLAVLVVLVIRD
jgi:hypothetical protein